MSQLECLRQVLYGEIESGDFERILSISQQLDELILFYTVNQTSYSRKTA